MSEYLQGRAELAARDPPEIAQGGRLKSPKNPETEMRGGETEIGVREIGPEGRVHGGPCVVVVPCTVKLKLNAWF